MLFFGIFFRTLGFLSAVAVFLLLLSIFIQNTSKIDGNDFVLSEGEDDSDNVIAVLNLSGIIMDYSNNVFISDFYNYIDPEDVKIKLENVKKFSPKILIVRINSPGGTVSATAELENLLNNFNKEKKIKIYFYTDEILTSGGYWFATSGKRIYAKYGSIIGSIGVSGPSWYYYDVPISISNGILGQGIETKNGIKIFNQSAGKSKDLYNPFREPEELEIKHLQNMLEEIYDDFVFKVSKSRKIEINNVRNEIGALIYSSNQAKINFLIDDILNYRDLIKLISKEEKFSNYKIIENNNQKNIFTKYLSNFNWNNKRFFCNKLRTNFMTVLPTLAREC